jgi:phosphoketolase
VVNDVDLMKLHSQTEHPHGLSDTECDERFTKDKPVIFAFHADPWSIHRLTSAAPTTTTSTSAAWPENNSTEAFRDSCPCHGRSARDFRLGPDLELRHETTP